MDFVVILIALFIYQIFSYIDLHIYKGVNHYKKKKLLKFKMLLD
jgi:hypothetical protein